MPDFKGTFLRPHGTQDAQVKRVSLQGEKHGELETESDWFTRGICHSLDGNSDMESSRDWWWRAVVQKIFSGRSERHCY